MSKFLKVMIVLLTIAAVATPVIAEDRLSLAGSMRVRGFYAQHDDGTNDPSNAWNDQRLRIGGKIAIAEGVSVNFRFDASESDENSSNDVAWGGSTKDGYAPYSHRRADIQFDKAYLQVTKGGYTLTAGQQYFGGFGTGHLVDTVGTGFMVKRGAVTLLHVKQYDKNQGNDGYKQNVTAFTASGALASTDADVSLTAAKFVYKTDAFTVTPMVSYTFEQGTDINRLGLGINAAAKLGAIGIKGEIVLFNGENRTMADEKGLQIYLDASTALSDTVKVGGIVLYAQGQDGGDKQVTYQSMPVFAEWHPENYGYHSTEFVSEVNSFDPSGAGAGVIALEVYADVKLSDDMATKFAVTYFQTEDDNIADVDGFILNAGLGYNLMKNTSINTQINYMDVSIAGSPDESDLNVISALTVKF